MVSLGHNELNSRAHWSLGAMVVSFKSVSFQRVLRITFKASQIAKFIGPTWAHLGPVGLDGPHVGPKSLAIRGFFWNCCQVNSFDYQSTFVHVLAWCYQSTSHYLCQYRPRSISPHSVTGPRWVNNRLLLHNITDYYIVDCFRTAILVSVGHLPSSILVQATKISCSALMWPLTSPDCQKAIVVTSYER